MNTAEIKKMSIIERIQTMEALWNSILYDKDLDPPDWHKKILIERKRKMEEGKTKFISLKELKKR